MTIRFDDLIEMLTKQGGWAASDAAPREALYLEFPSQIRVVKDTVIYYATDETAIVIDVNENGKVLGIEFV